MNAKKCKAIRKFLRSQGIDPRDTKSKEGQTVVLDQCGRDKYIQLKASVQWQG